MPIVKPTSLSELDVTTVAQVDAVLRSMTKTRGECFENQKLINFWLDIRIGLVQKQKEG